MTKIQLEHKFNQVLEKYHLEKTWMRFYVYYYLKNYKGCPTIQELFQDMKSKKHPYISIATLYNTIRILTKIHLLIQINIKGQTTRYTVNEKTNCYKICISCGRIEKITNPAIIRDMHSICRAESKADSYVYSSKLILYGLCNECKQKTAN